MPEVTGNFQTILDVFEQVDPEALVGSKDPRATR
jgi:hypothetical protein